MIDTVYLAARDTWRNSRPSVFPDTGVSPYAFSALMRYMFTHALEARMEVCACNKKAPVCADMSHVRIS
jgi:hypothetical protein